ncbi:hypothetical protein HS041_22395 [Planomonospora sp. ID67723]|uniref:hypothetical protein n=1 Tax=Planomonospora sp. ID67723 TaxID=2738134 RepID=UPI0018C3D785|nr:hypothetical protein [Planomonospora sp. ID67723]MBG0830515.1 hypothetical protein [Planomonospora sp. ID67723]
MADLPAYLLRHTVTVEPLTGEGPYGPEYGPAAEVRCFIDDKRRLVRDKTGAQVVSETTVFMPLATTCPVGSRVTLPTGRESTVLTSLRRDGGGLPTPDHLEVNLQ